MTSLLKNGWVVKPLIEVATLQRGYDLPVQDRSLGNVPIFAANGPVGNHNEAKVPGPGVITGRSGSIGKVHYVDSDYWPLNTALYVKDFHGNDPKFIYYMLSTFGLEKYSEGTGVPTLNRNNVHGVNVSLPPLPEQKRIAAILDKADSIRRKRQEAVRLTEGLLHSVFLDMFGDPVTNPKGWLKSKLSEVVMGKYGIKAGPFGSSLKKEDYTTSGYRIYGQEQVIARRFDIGDYFIGERKLQQLKGCQVAEGDLLVSLVGSFGKVLVVPSGIEPGIINPRLLKITPNRDLVTPTFLAAVIGNPSIQAAFGQMAHGGTMGILNVGLLKQLDVILPPLKLQREFAIRLDANNKLEKSLQLSLISTDTLFDSLLQRAFKGGV